jgi:thiamine kinase-like enzyme
MPDSPTADAESSGEEPAVRTLLAGHPATRPLAGGLLTLLDGGLSNRAWRVEQDGEAWFVRSGHPGAARLGVDRASECVVLEAVSAAGLAPGVLACDPASGLLVTRFIEGPTWRAEDVLAEGNLGRVAERLRCLHGLPIPAGAQEVRYSAQARRLAAGLPARSRDEAVLHERATRAFTVLDGRGYSPALCHHDLHHLNLIDAGDRLWLVDWEYGGRGDPLLDVAGFLALHELGPEPTRIFLEAYGRLGPDERALLGAARWAFDYVQWLWYRRRFEAAATGAHAREGSLARRLLHCDNALIAQGSG